MSGAVRELHEPAAVDEATGEAEAAVRPKTEQLPARPPEPGSRIHPALHFSERLTAVGIAVDEEDGSIGWRIVTSDRRVIRPEDVKLIRQPHPRPALAGRLEPEALAAYLEGRSRVPRDRAPELAFEAFSGLLDAPDDLIAVAVVWGIATYFHPLFDAVSYLWPSGERGSAKTKLLECEERLAFNPMLVSNVTSAALYRLIGPLAPTILWDEAETLGAEHASDLQSMFNSGYRRGATVPRCSSKDYDRIEEFQVFCPKALAAIQKPPGTIESRCIRANLIKSLDGTKTRRRVMDFESLFTRARSIVYQEVLLGWRDVRDAYDRDGTPTFLVGRDAELFRSLFAVAEAFDPTGRLGLVRRLTSYAEAMVSRKDPADPVTLAVLFALRDIMEKQRRSSEALVRPGELRDAVNTATDREVTPHKIGDTLANLGFERTKRTQHGGYNPYRVVRSHLEDLLARHGLAHPAVGNPPEANGHDEWYASEGGRPPPGDAREPASSPTALRVKEFEDEFWRRVAAGPVTRTDALALAERLDIPAAVADMTLSELMLEGAVYEVQDGTLAALVVCA